MHFRDKPLGFLAPINGCLAFRDRRSEETSDKLYVPFNGTVDQQMLNEVLPHLARFIGMISSKGKWAGVQNNLAWTFHGYDTKLATTTEAVPHKRLPSALPPNCLPPTMDVNER